MDEKVIRISNSSAFLMIGTAFLYDTLQVLFGLVPIVGWILNFLLMLLTLLTFNVLWFKIKGISFTESTVGGKVTRWWFIKNVGCPLIEIGTLGIAPMTTLWVFFTILATRLDDNLVAHNIVTREELELIDQSVKKLFKEHGAESPEFRQALAAQLGEHIEHRFSQAVDNKRARLINSNKIARVVDSAIRNSDN